MKITPIDLQGSYLVDVDRMEDSRGFFARLWCKQEFQQYGIDMEVVQVSISHNAKPGTLRGLHFQCLPSHEAKLVRCQRGRIYDVIIDLRPDSPTFMQHAAFELDGHRHNSLFIPSGFAHGFQTLEADTEILYMMSDYYHPDLQDGVRYDDSAFDIRWPLPLSSISSRDLGYPDFDPDIYSRNFFRTINARKSSRSSETTSTD
ncbi:MAG: dTDP-4-keto-6-deoxy-D-glucose epimerase [Gammaproteobacteria bacterium]|nr:dTDP-4-keto-6-deoxy-D-glucose epimerase [Gammaproteobacteria bacterium]